MAISSLTYGQSKTSEQSIPSPGSGPKSGTISSTRDEQLRAVTEEDAELDYLYERHEVGREDYLLTKDRHYALRKYLLTLPRNTIDLPELFVMTKAEFKDYFRNPPAPEKLRAGGIWEKRWVYRAKIVRGHTFYIFERQ
ncbi:MAG TPA: hypothetical protein VFC63_08800 [Blastocatellia bacterium]|nr:hypothetical protein [Blastocatellia bacterium]